MDFRTDPLLNKAYDFAELSLAGQKRKSGEDIIEHCRRVAEALTRMKVTDPATLAAALLHHSLSEGAATEADIRSEFGDDIAGMVIAFERLFIIRAGAGKEEVFIENLRKMFLVLAKDLRVVLIKLADILDNLATLKYLSVDSQKRIAQETLDIFAPLAERLGISGLRGEMQDLAFQYLYPEEYVWVKKVSGPYLTKLGKVILKDKAKLADALKQSKITFQIQSRIKHVYSLYTKLQRPETNRDIEKIYDLMAMRVLVETKEECYLALGIINKLFRPVGRTIADYIAHPKPNGYQSIHCWVYGPSNIPFEIQIRTFQMHESAEYGLAAHWNYAEKKESGLSDEKISQGFATSADKLEWVKNLSQWQEEVTNNDEFLKTIKTDFFGERIFCFTPKGDVKDLPAGATPVDFGYAIHTDLGHLITAAKVNGKGVGLDRKLQNGDVVELTLSKDKNKKPNRDWLSFVVTNTAKKRIKKLYYS